MESTKRSLRASMMLKLNVALLQQQIEQCNVFQTVGKLRSAQGLLSARLAAAVGELVRLKGVDGELALAQVIGYDDGLAKIMPFAALDQVPVDAEVRALGTTLRVPVGMELLGRVINALGEPIDDQGPLPKLALRECTKRVPNPMSRQPISQVFATGQKVIDGLLTMGEGQRVGLFAGSGVGKSSLLGEIAKHATADCNVIVMVGERGREVRPFIQDCLGVQGLARSVVIVSTSDQTPLMRMQAVKTAITIADGLRENGNSVLMMVDSLTRMAMAQREIGLLTGEPPTARGYTPSVFTQITQTLEQLGNSHKGCLTAILTVLVDGDDMNDPIADAVRSVVDGHIVLDRKLSGASTFPGGQRGSEH